jgi:hypothetical protein
MSHEPGCPGGHHKDASCRTAGLIKACRDLIDAPRMPLPRSLMDELDRPSEPDPNNDNWPVGTAVPKDDAYECKKCYYPKSFKKGETFTACPKCGNNAWQLDFE